MALASLAHRFVTAFSLCLFLPLVACVADPPALPPTELSSITALAGDAMKARAMWSIGVGKEDDSAVASFRPIALNDKIFAASSDGKVISLDAVSGKVLWRNEVGARLTSGVGADDTQLYVSGRDGLVYALSVADGKKLWEYNLSSEVLVPASSNGDAVVVRAADGRVTAIDASSGEQRWSTNFSPPALTVNGYSQPLLLENGVLVGLDDGRLVALSLSRGELLWESVISYPKGRSEVERLVDVDANVLIDDSHIYAVSYQGKLARLEPGRGQIQWSIDFSSTAGMTQDSEAVFVTDSDSRVVAVDKKTGEQIWQQGKLLGRGLTHPVLSGASSVAVADFEGYVHLLSRKTGELLGRTRAVKEGVRNAPVLAEGRLYLQSVDAKLVAVQVSQ